MTELVANRTGAWRRWVDRVERHTPPQRDRFVDAIRTMAILAVVTGHWLVAVVAVDPSTGLPTGTSLLVTSPLTRTLTWLWQVMPLFFVVGGVAHAHAWPRHRQRTDGRRLAWNTWVRARAVRLLYPTIPLVLLWTVGTVVLEALGLPARTAVFVAQVATVPLWFLAVYVLVAAVVPFTWWLHRRAPLGTVAAIVAGAAVIDVTGWAGTTGWWSHLNFLFVWGLVHQLGYWWVDGRLPTGARAAVIGSTAVALLAALVAVGFYPLSMVGVDGAARTNNTPPTLALLLLGVGQISILRLVESRVRRLLARPAAWAAVAVVGTRAMTVYLWHMTALLLTAGVVWQLGIGERIAGRFVGDPAAVVDARWWLHRPLWLGSMAVVLAVLIAAVGRFEQGPPRQQPASRQATLATVVGLVCAAGGIASLVLTGPLTPLGFAFGAPPAALTLVGAALLGVPVLDAARRLRPT